MNPDQIKVREFFKKFTSVNWRSSAAWFLAGLGILFLVVGCVGPVQAYMEVKDKSDTIMLVVVAATGPMVAYMRVQPYTLYMENQKSRSIFDLVKYYPIEKKEIKKMKTYYMVRFMAKLLPFCMLAQIPATLYDYEKLSIINFLYILVVAFVWPVLWGVIAIWTER